jgi:crossover junction endodeoxyribonuclease RuvC
MLILGIDPGTTRVGYGLIKKTPQNLKLLDCGIFTTTAENTSGRLLSLAKNTKKILEDFSPDILALERIFFFKNKKTAFEVAQAVGVLSLVSAHFKIEPIFYTPLEIKQSITGYGLADKEEVSKRVMEILGLKNFNGLDDTSDALAVALTAICRLYQKNNNKNFKIKK